MARYYLQFDTMKVFLALPPKAKISEILAVISQAAEFHPVRFRANEKSAYKELNRNVSIKFPIPVNLDATAHKVSLIVQAVLGAVELPTEDNKALVEFTSAKAVIFSNVHRLVRCIIDCQLHLQDSVTTRNALTLARSLGAGVWDDSPLHMKQLEGVGLVSVRKLATAGIKSFDELEVTEAHRLEMLMSRHPPFGTLLIEKARAFPKLRVVLKMIGVPVIKKAEYVTVKVKAEIGFLNDNTPEQFQRKPVYVCLLAETSDGHVLHFARISAKKLNKGQELLFSANLTTALQTIRAHVMCDDIAATARQAILKPEVPATAFPPPKTEEKEQEHIPESHPPNTSKRRISTNVSGTRPTKKDAEDEFGDADIDDAALAMAETGGFIDIGDIDLTGHVEPKAKKRKTSDSKTQAAREREPRQLANGKWECNHACKKKNECRHMCCRDGLDHKPKPSKPKDATNKRQQPGSDSTQSRLNVSVSKKANSGPATGSSFDKQRGDLQPTQKQSREAQDLHRLHSSVNTSTPMVPALGKTVGSCTGVRRSQPALEFWGTTRRFNDDNEAAREDTAIDRWRPDELPSPDELMDLHPTNRMSSPRKSEPEDDDMLDFDLGGFDFDYTHQPPGSGSEHVDLSPYSKDYDAEQGKTWSSDVDFSSILPEPVVQKTIGPHGSLPPKTKSTLFLSRNIDSDSGQSTCNAHAAQRPTEPNTLDDSKTSKFFDMPTHDNMRSHNRTQQLDDTSISDEQPTGDGFFPNDGVDDEIAVDKERPASSDDLEKWFKVRTVRCIL